MLAIGLLLAHRWVLSAGDSSLAWWLSKPLPSCMSKACLCPQYLIRMVMGIKWGWTCMSTKRDLSPNNHMDIGISPCLNNRKSINTFTQTIQDFWTLVVWFLLRGPNHQHLQNKEHTRALPHGNFLVKLVFGKSFSHTSIEGNFITRHVN